MAIHLVSGRQTAPGRAAGSSGDNPAATGQGVDFASMLFGLSTSAQPVLSPADATTFPLAKDNASEDLTGWLPGSGVATDPPMPLLTATPIAMALAAQPTAAVTNDSRRGIDLPTEVVAGQGVTRSFPMDLLVASRLPTTTAASDGLPPAIRQPADYTGELALPATRPVTDDPRIELASTPASTHPATAAQGAVVEASPRAGLAGGQQVPAGEPSAAIAEPLEAHFSSTPLAGAVAVPVATQPGSAPATVNAGQTAALAFGNQRQMPLAVVGEPDSPGPGSSQEKRALPLPTSAHGSDVLPATASRFLPWPEASPRPISAAEQPGPASFAEIGRAAGLGERRALRPVETAPADALAQPIPSANSLPFSAPAVPHPTGQADSPVAPQMLHTPLHDPAWNAEFGHKVLWLAHQDQQQAHLTINPPHLGTIEISVNLSPDNSATATFVAADAEVRSALESSLPRLREMFAAAGIDLGQVNVGSQSFRQSSEEQQHAPRTPRGMADKAILGSDLTGVPSASGLAGRIGDGLVDTFA